MEATEGTNQSKYVVYVGTYTRVEGHVPDGKGKGIYMFNYVPATGELIPLINPETKTNYIDAGINPTFLATDPTQSFLFAVNEGCDTDTPPGTVRSYAIDKKTGLLTDLNSIQDSHGAAPCHVSTDNTGKYLFVANYLAGSVSMYQIQADGKLSPACAKYQNTGSSVNQDRQTSPHAHSVVITPDNKWLVVSDLGTAYNLQPGCGPRHFVFNPILPYGYSVNELDSTVTVFDFGVPSKVDTSQTLTTLPSDFTGSSSTAEIGIFKGKYLYVSNRGHDSIAIFSIDGGQLETLGYESTQGKTPRGFIIDEENSMMLVANQDSHTIVTYNIYRGGELKPTGKITECASPVTLSLVKLT
eukprot:TRINITY_DN937_c0_g1_i2.p1 TRINITY_DN937_c0_g1~~TRINITY_DN937_c0_g1_i2.p1  ORF type:complete len:356 (-),score=55.77 TRINITY_DN937_c0_g1_i2:50-1117(-)